jgi:hypothetical protein
MVPFWTCWDDKRWRLEDRLGSCLLKLIRLGSKPIGEGVISLHSFPLFPKNSLKELGSVTENFKRRDFPKKSNHVFRRLSSLTFLLIFVFVFVCFCVICYGFVGVLLDLVFFYVYFCFLFFCFCYIW